MLGADSNLSTRNIYLSLVLRITIKIQCITPSEPYLNMSFIYDKGVTLQQLHATNHSQVRKQLCKTGEALHMVHQQEVSNFY